MKSRTIHAAVLLTALVFTMSCSDDPSAPESNNNPPPKEVPNGYPPVPKPSTPNEIIPDESEIYADIVPIDGKELDFAPYWTNGQFTWDVDVQTQYDRKIGGWYADAPG